MKSSILVFVVFAGNVNRSIAGVGGWRDARCTATRPSPDEWFTRAQPSGLNSIPCPFQSASILRVHVNREAALRAACALSNVFIFIFITHMYVPSSYGCRRVINVQRVTCVANDEYLVKAQIERREIPG